MGMLMFIDLPVFAWPNGGCQMPLLEVLRFWRARILDSLVSMKTGCSGGGGSGCDGGSDVLEGPFQDWRGLTCGGFVVLRRRFKLAGLTTCLGWVTSAEGRSVQWPYWFDADAESVCLVQTACGGRPAAPPTPRMPVRLQRRASSCGLCFGVRTPPVFVWQRSPSLLMCHTEVPVITCYV